jgi:hypothetical protein
VVVANSADSKLGYHSKFSNTILTLYVQMPQQLPVKFGRVLAELDQSVVLTKEAAGHEAELTP